MQRRADYDRFMALSRLYFQLSGEDAEQTSAAELEELLELLNEDTGPSLSPDQQVA